MGAEGTDGAAPDPERRFEELRRILDELKELLAQFDAHDGTRQAREGDRLSGDSRTRWREQEDAVACARRVDEAARRKVDALGPNPSWSHDLDRTPGELRQAKIDVEHALRVAGRIALVRTDYVHRLSVVKANAERAGASATMESAERLLDLSMSDPLERDEAEVEKLERTGFDSGVKAARDLLTRLGTVLATVREDVDRAVVRIAGFDPRLPDLDDLADWLVRIQRADAAGATSDSSSGEVLGRWQERARQADEQMLAAKTEAKALLDRRARLRGLWRTLGEKAAALGVRERPEVDGLLGRLRERLWTAPCDLDAAEDQLLALGNLLNEL
jgi:hypothetical protein